MELSLRLDDIRSKLYTLKKNDYSYEVFGAFTHEYNLNPIKSDDELNAFERKYGIQLPIEYRCFLQQLGNGGAGPFYGIEALENSLFQNLDNPDNNFLINPSLEFRFSEAWNISPGDCENDDYEHYDKKVAEYMAPKWVNGLLRVANFGCGVFFNIVVNGKEYGNIWVDDRCNNAGIYPHNTTSMNQRIGFLDWYEAWLDAGIAAIK